MITQRKTLVAASADEEPEAIQREEQEGNEEESIDSQDYGEYTQEPIQLRRSRTTAEVAAQTQDHTPPTSKPKLKRRQVGTTDKVVHPGHSVRQQCNTWIQRNLFHLGIGMLVTLVIWWFASTVVVFVGSAVYAHWTYGGDMPVTQWDANVGHHGTSHFLAEYWHGEVMVMEFPGGDATKARTYAFPLTTTHDTTHRVVTLHVETINLHGQAGKPDIVIQVAGYSVALVLYNTGDAFTTSQPN